MSDRRLNQASQDFAEDLAALRDDLSKLTGSVSDLVRGRASDAADQATGLFRTARSRANERAADARDEFASRAYDARDRLSNHASDLQDRLGSFGSDVETRIEKNPLTAVVVAGIAGLLMGMLSRSF